jgi:hypothetical protein
MFFYIETIPRDHDRQRLKDCGRGQDHFGKNCLSVWSLNLCLIVGNIPGGPFSSQLAKEVLPSPAPHPSLYYRRVP